jgi:6-pyruvoyl-tetrahydropterin synthase-like protein
MVIIGQIPVIRGQSIHGERVHLKAGLFKSPLALDPGWLVAAIIPLIAILPVINPDHIIQTADGSFHIHRMLAVTTLLQQGDLYPRWIPWFHVGYGYPVLNFYAPLATYLGGVMGVMGISAPNAVMLLIAITWIVGSLGMYALGRRCLNPYAGILAALLWSYAPSALQAVWNQGSLSQILGAGLLPWLFYSLIRVIEEPGPRRLAALALAFGLVILAHQPTTVLVALLLVPGLPLLCLGYARRQGRLKARLMHTLAGLALGAGVSAIFLLPMVLELPYIQASRPAADIPQTLAHSFLQADQLFLQPRAPDLSDLNPRLPETVGLVDGALALEGLLALLLRRRFKLALACAAACGLILFLMQSSSMPFWLATPLLAQLRFPGRALHVGRLFFALLGGASLLLLPPRWWKIATTGLALVVIAAALPTLYPNRPFLDYSNVTPVDEVHYEIATYSFGGTSYDEFKPVWGDTTPKDVPNLKDIEEHPLRINVIDPGEKGAAVTQSGDDSVQVVTDHRLDLSFRQFYFPGWAVTVDGAAVTAFPENRYGLLTLTVPEGSHIVHVQRGTTAVEQIAPFLTLISLGTVVWLWRRESSAVEESVVSLQPHFARLLMGGIAAFALVSTLYIQPYTHWFRQQSPLESPTYMQTPVHQRFGDAYELLGYSLHQRQVVPGAAVDITLYWRALYPLDHVYQPVTQLVNLSVSQAWAVSEKFFIGDNSLPHTPDYFVSDDHRLQVQADAPPYIGRLLVKLRDSQTGQYLLLPDGSDQLVLDTPVRIRGNGIPPQKKLNEAVGGSVELWCSSVQQQGDQLHVDLYWHVLQPLTMPDVKVFVHGFDARNQVVALFDGPMLNGDYPATDWLPGQNLADHLVTSAKSGLARLSVGLRLPAGDRLAVFTNGMPALENRIWLPLEVQSCVQP